ncbi:MAG: histidine kinase, partial [Actinomycetota bacterium]|nr:histidine kinase [Actinomycetota bacterium]
RRPRDWVVDTLLFLAAVVFGLLVIGGRLGSSTMPAAWLFTADVAAGALGCAGLWLRRRWPVGLAVVLAVFSTFSEVVSGALVVATLTVAIHRPPRTTAAVFGLTMLTGLIFVVVRPEPGIPAWLLFMIGLAVQSAAVGWGLFIHFRRQLVLSLRDRATRAETEAQLRAEQAQQRARDEIAREMHDVLGHRLSLLSVHAGALEFRPDAPAEEVARAAKVIRENAHQALQDLREVIGVLRAPVGELPQPTLADVRQLVAESGRAGMRVSLRDETGGPVPELAGRTAYRVVQEALTNARKHAPGAEVRVHLAGSPGAGLTVEVRNEAFPAAADHDPGPAGALHPDPPLPGPPVGERSPTTSSGPGVVHSSQPAVAPGQGLAGLAERVALADGRLEHGPTAEGGWRLSVWLPWPP